MKTDYQLENLSEAFCKDMNKTKADPFLSDIVITQSSSMESYLNRKLADKNQIAVNINYISPRIFITDIFKICNIDIKENRFARETLIWKIYKMLPEMENKYEVIRNYVESDKNNKSFKRYQLANEITNVFDTYIAYRGEWLEKWQENEILNLGEHEEWQSDLWRKLSVDCGSRFLRATQLIAPNIKQCKDSLPKEISIFGISNLPKDYIEFFTFLSNYIEIKFYYLTPCLEYWSDATKKSAHLENIDNKLLVSWGVLGRDFFKLLLDNDFDIGGDEAIEETEPTTFLSSMQYDILHNLPDEYSQMKNKQFDNSIIINNCYSRMREVEVLYDQVLDLLNCETSNISASDIVVMAPNMEEYTPYIKAIFDNKDWKSAIPFTIADRSINETSKIAESFINILNIASTKITAQDMYDIISSEAIAHKFGLSIDDLSEIHKLILDSNIIWGENCEHRKSVLGQEFNDINSWEFGFNRLIAGYAFDTESIVDNGVLPLPLKNNQPIILGKFKTICDLIFKYSKQLRKEHSPDEWYSILLNIINEFFVIENTKNEELDPVYNAITVLNYNLQNAEFEEKLSLQVIKQALSNDFSMEQNQKEFFKGGLTFCRLLPMRNIPFKIICIMGLNEGEFPRLDKQCGFDLSHKNPISGDRSMRKDDRYIFLETVMACREKLYLSFVGQSNASNEEIPPSILISEMIDYITNITEIKEENLITKHPLQPFNKKYFTGNDKYFSYSKTNCEAAKALSAELANNQNFCDNELPLRDKDLEFSFDDFINFFLSPAKFFLNYRLKINLYNQNIDALKNCEPFDLNKLDEYLLKDKYLESKLSEKNIDILETEKASGAIPYGIWGDEILDSAETATNVIYERVKLLGDKKEISSVKTISKTIDGINIKFSGQFNNFYNNSQAFFRPGKIKDKDKLKAWIWHNLALETDTICETFILGYDKNKLQEINFKSTESRIDELIKIFIRGLRKPLPLFLNSSAEYANQLKKAELEVDYEKCLKSASTKWEKDEYSFDYDLNEDANKICFGDESPILDKKYQSEFMELSEAVYYNMMFDA